MHLMVGKGYLKQQIEALGLTYDKVFGWMTAYWRKQIGLEKSHSNDAIVMVCKSYKPVVSSLNWLVKPKRAKVWDANPTKTCTEKNGFKHWDLIKANHRTKGIVVGSIRSLKAKVITLRTKFDDNFAVSYNKSNLIQRFNGLIYSYSY